MKKYQIIPRKFRPLRFEEVVGHEAIVATLKNSLTLDRIGQAYLFCGARGCGKTTLARLFAKALNCPQRGDDSEPCNACTICKEIIEGRNLDIIEIDGASNRGIDDIRQLNETVGYAPNQGPYKIYIIDEVHMLTKEAFNALLKTLEEPPKNVKFFFATTEPHKIPQTIISRCQRFNLGRIPENALVAKLKMISQTLEIAIEDEALVQISHLSEGSLRDAESLLDQLICCGKTPLTLALTREMFGLVTHDILFDLDEAIHTQNFQKAIQLGRHLYQSGKDLNAYVDSLLEHFRTYLHIQLGQQVPSYEKWASHYSQNHCLLILDILIKWQQHLFKTPFKQVHLEMMMLDLVRSLQKIPLDSIVQRLIDLEERLKQGNVAGQSPPPEPSKAVEPPKEEELKAPAVQDDVHPSKHDTLIRFAAVELEGSVNT